MINLFYNSKIIKILINLITKFSYNIFFNEIAPRPHNSFHWTLDGCSSSQFDILIRTICGLPVKNVISNGKWEMTNIIGQYDNMVREICNDQNYKLY